MTDSTLATSKIALVLADVGGTLLTSGKVLTSQAAMAVKCEALIFERSFIHHLRLFGRL